MLSNEIDRINSGGLLQRIRIRRRPDPELEPAPEMSIMPYYGSELDKTLEKPLRPHEENKIIRHIKTIGGFKTAKILIHRKMYGSGFMDFMKDIASSAAGKFIKVALSTIITLFTGIPAETIIETLSPFIESLGTEVLNFVVKNANKGFDWIVNELQKKQDIKEGKKQKKKTKKTKKKKAAGGLKILTPEHPLYHRLMKGYIPLDEVINKNKKKLGGKGFNDKLMDGLLWFTHDLVKPVVSHIPIIGHSVGTLIGDVPKYLAERLPGAYEYENPFDRHTAEQQYIRPPDIKREGIEKGITQSQTMKGRGRKGGKIFDPKKGFWSNHLAPLATMAKDIALDYAGQELAAAWKGEKPVYQQLKEEFNRRTAPQRPQGPQPPPPPTRQAAYEQQLEDVARARDELRSLGREASASNPFLGPQPKHEPAMISQGEEMKFARPPTHPNMPQGIAGLEHNLGDPPKAPKVPKAPRQSFSDVLSAFDKAKLGIPPLEPHPKFKHNLGIFNPREPARKMTSQTFEPEAPSISQSNLFQQQVAPIPEQKMDLSMGQDPRTSKLQRELAAQRASKQKSEALKAQSKAEKAAASTSLLVNKPPFYPTSIEEIPPKFSISDRMKDALAIGKARREGTISSFSAPAEQPLVRARALSSSSEDYTPFTSSKSLSPVGTPELKPRKAVPKAEPIIDTKEYSRYKGSKEPVKMGQTEKSKKIKTPSLPISSASSGEEYGFQPQTPPMRSRSLVPPPPKVVPIFKPAPPAPKSEQTFFQRMAQGPIGSAAMSAASPFISSSITSALDKGISSAQKAAKDAAANKAIAELRASTKARKEEIAKGAKAAAAAELSHAEFDRIFNERPSNIIRQYAETQQKAQSGVKKRGTGANKRKTGKGKKKAIKRKTGKGKKKAIKRNTGKGKKKRLYK